MLAAVAIHPNEAPAYADAGRLDEAIAVIDELAAQPRVRAIGETGLDFFRTGEDGLPAQFESVRGAHRPGQEARHRDADPRPGRARGGAVDARARGRAGTHGVPLLLGRCRRWRASCADRGYYLSFAGNVTFKNAQNLRDALAVTPRERILVETDAPFLTPIPHRGRPNAPYLIPVTVRFMAAELGVDLDEFCAQLAANTLEVYGSFS